MNKERFAKLIRFLSIPPFMVIALTCTLYFRSDAVFYSGSQIAWIIALFVIIPALAYPCQKFVPAWKEQGRSKQRKLAFIFSLVGYSTAVLWSCLSDVSMELRLLTLSYFFNLLILIIFNKYLKIKSSGHACSAATPILFALRYFGWKNALIWCVVYAAVIWSSLLLKRHTVQQITLGSLTSILSFVLSFLLLFGGL